MFATKVLRQASAAAERTPMIKFVGKRTIPSSIDHTPRPHPASPTHELPKNWQSSQKSSGNSSASFSSYRQTAQQHGPLGRVTPSATVSGISLGPVAPSEGEYFDRNELPERYRRTLIDLAEIDAIETGGATLVG